MKGYIFSKMLVPGGGGGYDQQEKYGGRREKEEKERIIPQNFCPNIDNQRDRQIIKQIDSHNQSHRPTIYQKKEICIQTCS